MISKNESTITLQHFDKNKTNLTEQNSSFNAQIGLVKAQTKSDFNSSPKTPIKKKRKNLPQDRELLFLLLCRIIKKMRSNFQGKLP